MNEEEFNDGVNVSTTQLADSVPETKRTPRCGLFCWRPDFLQVVYNWKLGIGLICLYAFFRGVFTAGITSLNTSTLERQFNVNSQQIGWFTSANRLSTSASALVVSYIADRYSNKPQLIALSAFANALGSLLIAMPHWIMEPYHSQASGKMPSICYLDKTYFHSLFPNSTFGAVPSETNCKDTSSSYFGFLIAGNVVKGIGAGTYVSVGVAFIDDISTMAASSFHIGATMLSMSIGTAVGFGAGTSILKMDVNFDKPGVPKQNPSDPNFLGAWWLGYAISIGCFGLIAIAFLFFDYELPETAKLREEKVAKTQTHVNNIKVVLKGSDKSKLKRLISDFLEHVVRVLSNPVLLTVVISHIISQLTVGGMHPFFVKILSALWGLNETTAGLMMSILVLIGVATGTFVSGYVVKRVKLTVRGLLLLSVFTSALSTALCFVLALTCPQTKFIGINYENSTSDLLLPCNSDCRCRTDYFSPVCDSTTKLHYYSACHAGCQYLGLDAKNKTIPLSFRNCKCVDSASSDTTNSSSTSSIKYGLCDSSTGCVKMYIAMTGQFLMLFCGFFMLVPLTQVIIRSVPLEERSFSLAFSESVQSLLGSVPAPLFMGSVLDMSCIMKQPKSCGGENSSGACAVYNGSKLSWFLVGIMAASAFVAMLCHLAAFLFYKPPSGEPLRDYFRSLKQYWQQKCARKAKTERVATDIGHDGPYTIS